VTGVSGAEGGIGYFGYSFYIENEGTVKALEIDGGSGCVAPSVETAQDGSYTPLSRPLYIYPSAESLKDETTKAFLEFYVDNVNDVAEQVGFVPLTSEQKSKASDDLTSLEG
jgi:phosphate transport system substrate-binding protein